MKKTTRNANGLGTIRKRKNGTWEARYTLGRDSNGRQIQKSIYGRTQEEVRQKLAKVIVSIDDNSYVEPSKMTIEQWLNQWMNTYVENSVKPATVVTYAKICNNHLIPRLGTIKLSDLNGLQIQNCYNVLYKDVGLSAKYLNNIHFVLHRSLEQAVKLGLISKNPTEYCDLPQVIKKKMHPLETDDIRLYLQEIKGHRYENLFFVALFSGTRQGEILGLSWDCVNFETNSILINKQLQLIPRSHGQYRIVPTKTGRERIVTLAPAVMNHLVAQKKWQDCCKKAAGSVWNNEWNLVFTDETGENLKHRTVLKNYKAIVRKINIPESRFHDLRHSFAVLSLESGDDIKTVQENLGHATSSFTLDVYGHISQNMRLKSAANMQKYIDGVS